MHHTLTNTELAHNLIKRRKKVESGLIAEER